MPTKQGKKKTGRLTGRPPWLPTVMTAEMQDEIIRRIADGESLRGICRSPGMPDASTVTRFLADDRNTEFRARYLTAREMQADALFDEILLISDEVKATQNQIQKARVRIDARKWMAGKLRPKKYGDRVINEHSGVDGGPIETVTRIELVAPGHDDSQD